MRLFDVIVMATFSLAGTLQELSNPSSTSHSVLYLIAGLKSFGCLLVVILYTPVLHFMILQSVRLSHFDKMALQVNHKIITEVNEKGRKLVKICI